MVKIGFVVRKNRILVSFQCDDIINILLAKAKI